MLKTGYIFGEIRGRTVSDLLNTLGYKLVLLICVPILSSDWV